MVISDLIEGENSFRRLAENLPGIVYRILLEDDNRMIFFNDMVQTMTGYSPEDLKKGKVCSIDPLILPEDRENVINIVKDAIENNVPFEVEYRINSKSGELKWFFERGRPIRGDIGNISYIDGVIFDITKRKKAEKKLKESEEKFRKQNVFLNNILKSLTHPFYVINTKDYRVELANSAAFSEGLEQEHYCYSLIHNRNMPCVAPCKCLLDEVKKTKRTCVVEHIHYDNEGNEKMHEVYGYPILDESGNVTQMIEYALDISDRKKAEEALLESEERFRNLVEQSLDGVVLIDEKGLIIEWNEGQEQISGLKKKDVLGTPIWEVQFQLIPDENKSLEQLERMKRVVEDCLMSNNAPWIGKIRDINIQRADNKKNLTIQQLPFLIKTRNKIMIGNFNRDITEQKQIQKELRENEGLLKNAQELAHIGHWKLDPSTMEVTGSDELFKIFGLSHDEATLEKFADVVHPDDREMDLFHIRRCMEKGESWDIEHRVISKEGIEKWVHALGEAIKDDDGKVIMLMGTVQDITTRKKMMEELHIKDIVFNASLSAQSTADINGIINHVNPAFLELWGYNSKEEAIGNSVGSFFANPDDGTPILEALNETGKWEGEFLAKRCDGSTFISQGFASAIYNENGDKIGFQSANLNITKRKEVELKLKREKEKANLYINMVEVILVALDRDGRITLINKKGHELLGYEEGELIGKDWFKVCLPPHDWKRVQEYFKKLMVGELEVVKFYENPIWAKTGEEKLISWSSVLFKNENGDITGLLSSGVDITERAITEQKLIESESKYKSLANELEVILDHIPGIVVYKDTENNILRVNKFMADAHNLEKTEMENRSSFDFYPKDIAQAYWEDDLEVISSKKPKLNIVEPWEIDAGSRWVNTSKIPYIDENGNVKGIIAIAFDITERMLAEKKLKESEKKFKLLYENAPLEYQSLDSDGNILEVNKAWINFFGYSKEEVIGKWFGDFIDPEYLDDFNTRFPEFKETGEVHGVEFEIIKKDSSHAIVLLDGNISYDEKGNFKQSHCIFQDITERKKAELKLKESEEKFKLLFESIADPIHVIDADLKIMYINPAFERWLKSFNMDLNIVGKNPVEAWPFIGERVNDEYQKVFKTNQIHIKEDWTYADDRSTFTETRKIPILKSGKVVQVITIIRDFSDRKKAEQKLKESEEKFRKQNVFLNNILESLTHPFYVINVKDYTITLANATASSEGLEQGKYCYSLTHHNNKPCEAPCVCPLEEVKNTKKLCVVEHKHYDKEGNEKIYEIYGYPILDENGNVVQMIEYALNITPRKIAQRELKESEKKYRHLFENSPYYIMLLNKDGNFIDCNNSTIDIYGYPKEDFLGKNFREMSIIPPELLPLIENKMELLFKEEMQPPLEFIPIRKDGKKIWINSQVSLIKLDNEFFIYIIGQDITERKKAERKLKESEEKYRDLANQWQTTFDAMSECVFLLDLERNILQYNKITLDFLGKKDDDEIIGHSCCETMHGSNEPVEWCPMVRMIESSHKESSIVLMGDRWCEISVDPVISDEGILIGAVHIIADITEREKIERELKESEERFKTLFEVAPASIIYSDLNANILMYNEQFLKLHEIKRPETIRKTNVSKFFSKQDLPKLRNEIQKSIEGSAPKPTEFIMLKEDGTEFPAEASSSAVRDKNGIVVGLIGVAQDITNRKKAEIELKESEEKFRTIAERTFMGILIIQDNQVKYANDALSNMLEYSQKEIINWEMDDLAKLIHPEDLSSLREYREHLSSSDTSFKTYYSFRVFTKSSKIKWIDQFSKEILYRGRLAELITIIDITEKKEAEQELIKLHNMKSELLRRTSHELKTPLVSIKGFSDLLLELHRDKLDNYVIRTIEQIRMGCNRLESLVNDILKASELESGTGELKKSNEDLSLLIKICVSELEGLLELRNHTINLEISDNLICSFEKNQIYNVITNILSNAIKYTPFSGKIEIKSEITNDFIIISIKDNGIGFSKEEKTQIFKQFGKIERYGQGYDVISEGSGLGLYISKKIMEMHDGGIWVESEGRDKGSTFYFSLPMI